MEVIALTIELALSTIPKKYDNLGSTNAQVS